MVFAFRSTFQLSVLALALASIGAPAAPVDWAFDISSNWLLPTSWAPVGRPNSNSDLSIVGVTGLKTVTHDTDNDTIHSLITDGSAIVIVTGGSSLQVNNGGMNGNTFGRTTGSSRSSVTRFRDPVRSASTRPWSSTPV